MKKVIFIIFSLFLVTLSFSQEKAIKITNQTLKKEIVIKDNKRVKIKTLDGRKISGRFKIQDDNTIQIKNEIIRLSNITEIKRNSLLISIIGSTFFIYAGSALAGGAVIIGLFAYSSAFLLTIPAAAMIYAGIKPPNFQKNYKNKSNWTYEIITISE